MFDKLRYIKDIRAELLNIEDNAKQIEVLTESQWATIRASHRLLGEYLDVLSQPSLPSNLDEEAEENSKNYYCSCLENYNETGICDGCENVKLAFKACAEWMAGQGETVDGEIILLPHTQTRFHLMAAIDKNLGYKVGDKVVVQIRKK